MKELEYLIEKYINGEITDKDLEELNHLLKSEENRAYFKKAVGLNYKLNLKYVNSHTEDKKAVFKGIKTRGSNVRDLKPRRRYLRIAAIMIVAMGTIFFYFFQKHNTLTNESKYVTIETESGATEVLKDNSFEIKTKTNEILVQQKGDTITYSSLSNKVAISKNVLSVPKGKKVVIALADGSVVHLNSGSKLTYPSGFKENETREVLLEGEGYFKVYHDEKRPFIVHSAQLDVEVLGTSFNFSAYKNNSYATAVLVQGKVAVKRPDKPTVYLQPGMMAKYSKSSDTFKTAEVDTNIYTAWMNGILVFEEQSLGDIANTLERKFNKRIIFEDESLKRERFTAKFENQSISKILESFKQSYDFEYHINDNEVIIR
ncbi:FecR family protein [Zunongwangia pacifica]|uniref:DUF4974 domain-containing protein n=1 Tax=Zunongwangia pacifica TaxID=2911062 RepID=A0A9X1ZRR6_9FLAO|nr:FecR domain-containing protein [Zunongwangia pacifica]MCL6219837.1 DUF4974 domain-containing protein [Zunongwangia pacifica]